MSESTDGPPERASPIDQLIRQGRVEEARTALEKWRADGIAPRQRAQFANLARRADLTQVVLKLLNPVVRPAKGKLTRASDSEKVEYAAALIDLGAIPEGVQLLGEVDAQRAPEALLFQAFGGFAQWDYGRAVPLLRQYLGFPLAEYPRLIGRVNLAAALLIIGETAEANSLLTETRSEAEAAGAGLLAGNCLELMAQVALKEERLDDCRELLNRSAARLAGGASLDELLAAKWNAVLSLKRSSTDGRSPDEEVLKQVWEIKRRAEQWPHWETVRDCDFHLAVARRDGRLATHLFHGSPGVSYRARITRAPALQGLVEDSYVWVPSGGIPKHWIDQATGTVGDRPVLEPGSVSWRTLGALSRDFYRPLRVAAAFSEIFPDDYYNPESSPHRVHSVIHRLSAELREAGVGLSVRQLDGVYSLESTPGFGVQTARTRATGPREDVFAEKLRLHFPAIAFTSGEAAKILAADERTSRRWLVKALERGILERTGKGPATRYRFPGGGQSES